MNKVELHRALTRVLIARIPRDCVCDLELLRDYIEESEPVKHGRWIEENSVSERYLSDWYISSIDNTETPIWTDEHIEELCRDFWLIPKTRMDGDGE